MNGPKTFRKKPVEIQAMQWTPDRAPSANAVADWLHEHESKFSTRETGSRCVLVIETLEGPISAAPGDWVIQGIAGEFYPCKPDIFAATYEQVAA